jgi:hypothetical protein
MTRRSTAPQWPERSRRESPGIRGPAVRSLFLRNKQLNQGAKARVARDGHKATYIAVLEVMGQTVSWSRE